MTPFDQALSYVHDALTQKRGSATGSRASLASLRGLAEASRGLKPIAVAEAKKAPPSPPAHSASNPGLGAKGLAARVRAAMGHTETTEAPKPPVVQVAPSAPPAPPAPSFESAPLSKQEQMEALHQRVSADFGNSPVVFGVGSLNADLVFVGEAPGVDEVSEGEPFVGRSGQLLTKIIEAMGFRREEVYLANVMKCRPPMPEGEPGDRKPTPDEMATHLPFLIEQIEIIRPRCIVALGGTAMEGLLNKTAPIGEVRGHWHSFKGTPLMPTYHPAYLLHNPSITEKRKVWEDLLQVLELLGRTITPRQRSFFLSKG